jgi:polyphosphate kinase 2 (PPK2 family)
MKIHSKNFRVEEGDKVNLGKWPTRAEPVYKSKEDYQKFLGEHVEKLSSLQQVLYAPNRHAILLIFQAMYAAGKDDVRRQPAGLPGVQLQASHRYRIAARLPVAHHPRAA